MQWLQRQGRNDEKQLPNYKPILPRIPTLTPGAVPITRIRSDDLGMVNEIRTSLGSLSPLHCFCLTKATCNKHVGMSQNSEVLTCPQTQSFYYLTYPLSHYYPDEKPMSWCSIFSGRCHASTPPAAPFAQLSRGFLAKGRSAALATSSGLTRIERSSPWRIAIIAIPRISSIGITAIQSIHGVLGSSN